MPDYMQLFPKGIQWLQLKKNNKKTKPKNPHTSFQKFKFIDVNDEVQSQVSAYKF